MTGSTALALAALATFMILAVAEIFWAARPGATTDGRLITNFGLGVINMAVTAALPIAVILVAGTNHYPGVLAFVVLPAAALCALAIVWRTFVQYLAHRLLHAVPLLWRFHRVHHGDRQMDLSTFLRNHPLELLVVFSVAVPTQIALGLPAWAVLLAEGALFSSNMITHANIRLPLDRQLASLVTTPGYHLSHHSAAPADYDSNFGELLTLWDWLFGTYRYVPTVEALGFRDGRYGSTDHLFGELLAPFSGAAAQGRGRR
jgi:sterol desaturase/sphingolipid hydroxylase (fatty acid hydroxylase superfamily)